MMREKLDDLELSLTESIRVVDGYGELGPEAHGLLAKALAEARLEALEQAAAICEAGDHCRYVDHVQEFCACRTHAAAIRALKAAPEQKDSISQREESQ